jgi:hypothetical protein
LFVFAIEGAADGGEGFGERKDLSRNKQIGVFSSDRMPEHTLSGDRDFGHQVRSRNRDTFSRSTTQSNPTYDLIFFCNLLLIEEAAKLVGFSVRRNSRCQSHSKSQRTSGLNTFACSTPRAGSAMKVVQVRCRAVEADLQNDSIAWQRAQDLATTPGK